MGNSKPRPSQEAGLLGNTFGMYLGICGTFDMYLNFGGAWGVGAALDACFVGISKHATPNGAVLWVPRLPRLLGLQRLAQRRVLPSTELLVSIGSGSVPVIDLYYVGK